jgi:hypothetical protein
MMTSDKLTPQLAMGGIAAFHHESKLAERREDISRKAFTRRHTETLSFPQL